jgi:hypothetical protein
MKVKVIVDSISRYECEIEADTLDEAITEAKMDALGEGDYISQSAEFEILEESPPAPIRLVPRVKKPGYPRPFWARI